MFDASSTLISLRFRQNAFLERLPHELLLVVFNWIRIIAQLEGSQPSLEPLSKTLVPFVRRNLYRNVKINVSSFLEFCSTADRHSLHSGICGIVMRISYGSCEPDWRPHEDRLLHFFRSTTQLAHIDFQALSHLPLLLLSLTFASVCLPNLQSLFVTVHQPDLVAAFRFRRLYSQLEMLTVISKNVMDLPAAVEAPEWFGRSDFDGVELPLDRVSELNLRNDLDQVETPEFVSTFTAIRECALSIDWLYAQWDLVRILEHLCPTHLRSLSIREVDHDDNAAVFCEGTAAAILRLEQLDLLELSGNAFSANLFPILHRLPNLATLYLDENPYITLPALESLLVGPKKIETLLTLEVFWSMQNECWRGNSYRDVDHVFSHSEDYGMEHLFCPVGWEEPRWSDEFPLEDAVSFLELAEEVGVDPGDHLQEAMQIEVDYEDELEQYEIYSGSVEGMARANEKYQEIIAFRVEIEAQRLAESSE